MTQRSKPKVVAAVQPSHLETVFTPAVEARLAQFAEVLNLGRIGQVTAENMAEAMQDAAGLITCWGTPPVTLEMVEAAENLKIIAHSAGSVRAYIDRRILDRGVIVTSQAGAIANAVVEYTIGLILVGLRLVWHSDRLLQAHRFWKQVRPSLELSWEIAGRTVGVVSLSRIGRSVAKKLTALEADVIAYDPYAGPEVFADCGAESVTLEDLFSRATVVTVHAPVTEETKGMIGADLLARLADGSLIVNTARGAVFDHAALEAELVSGRLRAVLDVTDPEPPPQDSPLFGLENVMLTPHQAGLSIEARHRQGFGAVEDVRKALAGEPVPGAITQDQWDILA